MMRKLIITVFALFLSSSAFGATSYVDSVRADNDGYKTPYNGGASFNWNSYIVQAGDSTVRIGVNTVGSSHYVGHFRFQWNKPATAENIKMYLRLNCGYSSRQTATLTWSLACFDSAGAYAITDSTKWWQQISSTKLWANLDRFTTARVTNWEIVAPDSNKAYQSPDIYSLYAETGAGTQPFTVFVYDTNSTANRDIYVLSVEENSQPTPLLYITYDIPDAATGNAKYIYKDGTATRLYKGGTAKRARY